MTMEKRRSHSQLTTNNQTVYGSLAAGDDLMDTILLICEDYDIRSGMVTCIGSLEQTGFTVFKTEGGKPSGYAAPSIISEPVELIQATGFICEDETGELDLHMHGLVERQDERIQAGHFLRGLNKVCITVEFVIQTSPVVAATRQYDRSLGYKVMNFTQREESNR